MPKFIPIFILLVTLVCSLTACNRSVMETQSQTKVQTQTSIQSSPATTSASRAEIGPEEYFKLFNGKTIATVYMKNSPEYNQKVIEDYYKNILKLDLKFKSLVYVDSLTDGLLMLRSHKIDALHAMRFTGDYLTLRNNDLNQYLVKLGTFSTQMIFNAQKQDQFDLINATIKTMKEDGSLNNIIDKWITNLPVGEEPSGGEMPVIRGGETLKVGISGDEPPLDYIAADGTPGGFNVAVLSEISQRTQINIQLVTVVSGARFAALQSGKIDAFLWHNALNAVEGLPESVISPEKDTDPDGFLKSVSYLDDKESLLVMK